MTIENGRNKIRYKVCIDRNWEDQVQALFQGKSDAYTFASSELFAEQPDCLQEQKLIMLK